MFGPRLDDDEKYALKWMLIAGMVTAGTTALCDFLKTEAKDWLGRRREASKQGDAPTVNGDGGEK